ncbi:Rpp20 subunit of nuclear RNase MRP and P-domain-containing protein [Podospora australis]|uniref:Rpp20 subunit of nuclear RNase MRP and P-domain-containing protein n=1 Tax=Podospora australis TaxID=1536484 RepID=A0AAN6WQ93_9PEZI|nr:Rpp20 subunit of nuclear RNase MRP and P-domain-containing protein [Podospora australis]
MATSPTTSADEGAPSSHQQQKPLPNRPENKLAAIPKGSRIHKRPLPIPPPRRTLNTRVVSTSSSSQAADTDGYIPPPRAPYTVIIKVASSASFMSLVKRVRKALESNASRRQKTKGLPLTAQIAALNVQHKNGGRTLAGPIEDALDDVVLIATGRAIQKAVDVGAYFTREQDLTVLARTRTVQAIDDIEMVDEDAEEEDSVRVRQVSCLEVGIRWS